MEFNKKFAGLAGVLLGVSLIIVQGCTPASPPQGAAAGGAAAGHDHDHDHDHDHPETFGEAVSQVEALVAKIRSAFEADDHEAADGPVHEIGHVLEDVGPLLEKAGLSEEQQKSVNEAVQTLFARFAEVDELLHGGEGKKFSDVASEVEAAVAALKAAAGL